MFRRALSSLIWSLVVLCLLAGSGMAQWQMRPRLVPQPKPPDSILVRFREGKVPDGRALAERLAQQPDAPKMRFRREIKQLGILVYRLADPRQMEAGLKTLRALHGVKYAEPSQRITLLREPNDPYFRRIDREHALFWENEWLYQWPLHTIRASDAWSVWPVHFYTAATKPANAVKVAVIDSGIDYTHPDFINAGGASTDALAGGQLDLTNARNMLNGGDNESPNDPLDENGHGTHVAGIIAAATNNARGIASLGFNAQILPIKVTDPMGDGDDVDVIDAMLWAADNGALIINMSLALNGGYSQALQDAVDYCWERNTLVIAAAGNDGVDYVRRYPAACNKVLAVAATTFASSSTVPPYESYASYSNRGMYIGIAAPGGDASYFSGGDFGLIPELYTLVWSTTPTYPAALVDAGIVEPTYGYLNGTSMASPHVAGLAALYAGSRNITQQTPGAPQILVRAIQRGADNILGSFNGRWNTQVGYGRINAFMTLQNRFGELRSDIPPGGITGQVTYNETAVQNAAIVARRDGFARPYTATTFSDGTYRLPNLPPGNYSVHATFFGVTMQKRVVVESGCDTMAVDFALTSSSGGGGGGGGGSEVNVTISPNKATVPLGGSQPFTATVTGASNTSVTWSVVAGPGTIGADGIYYAPASLSAHATAIVRATSVADPNRFDSATVQIAPFPLSVEFDLTPVIGGRTVTGTVTLSTDAPVGGVAVNLTSSSPSTAAVPPSVTVPAGQTSATFPVNTTSVTSSRSVTITARANGGQAQGVLRVIVNPSVSSVTITPNPVRGGNSATGKVTLSSIAPADGIVVDLNSTDTGVAQVPAQVTVPGSASSVNFSLTTEGVATQTIVNISARYNGSEKSRALTVNPAVLKTLTLDPATIQGGSQGFATIELNGKAPAGGLEVTLTSSNTAVARVPATVTVPAGSSTATFQISTSAVRASVNVTIRASVNGSVLTKTLRVTP
jgi:hypothetical protein